MNRGDTINQAIYLLNVQRAISQTEAIPEGCDFRDYRTGWEELALDLAYAASLGETATRQHLFLWNDDLLLENAEEIGYLARVKAIKRIMENLE